MPAKYMLDGWIRHHNLREMLEWRVEIDHEWSLKPGNQGRYLKRRLPAEYWSELEATFAGPGIEENWQSLFGMIALFRKTAVEVGSALGYAYPYDLDQRATAFLQRVWELDKKKRA
jgi:aminoglycoside 6-adenylyltransferase